MPVSPTFPADELAARLDRVRHSMAAANLDGLVVSVPENIYYLTGIDHWGFFACHILVVPCDGQLALVARAMERVTVENQVANADFYGHGDDEELSDYVAQALNTLGLATARLGLEKRSLFLTPRHFERILQATPDAQWCDASGLVDDIRLVKSPLEQAYTRKAAEAADAGVQAAVAAVRDGASDYEVAAECHRAMILAGSEYPGFGPFIRPTRRLGEEHTTWRGDIFRDGDAVFLEIGASYRKYQAPMGRLVYVGHAPELAYEAAELSIAGMQAIVQAIKPNATAGEVYAAWERVARDAGLGSYHRHHCGYLVGVGFPPSWTGGSMVTSLAPGSSRRLQAGMVFHAHSWFTDTGRGDDFSYFISNTVMLTEDGCEVLTYRTPEALQEC
ncbi:MAG: Xaa-Pro peptidase family protein [Kiloniellales bacterium]|nr:Xaa-Pro peptidase family protein [Kiloniellales bacterium]